MSGRGRSSGGRGRGGRGRGGGGGRGRGRGGRSRNNNNNKRSSAGRGGGGGGGGTVPMDIENDNTTTTIPASGSDNSSMSTKQPSMMQTTTNNNNGGDEKKKQLASNITNHKFAELQISTESRRALSHIFKYEYMTTVQAETLPLILSEGGNKDCLAKAKTGTGAFFLLLLCVVICFFTILYVWFGWISFQYISLTTIYSIHQFLNVYIHIYRKNTSLYDSNN